MSKHEILEVLQIFMDKNKNQLLNNFQQVN